MFNGSSYISGSSHRLMIFPTLLLLALLLLFYLISWRNHSAQKDSWLDLAAKSTSINHKHAVDDIIEHLRGIAEWEKPADLKVVALVFYGRRRFVQILDCYLKVHTYFSINLIHCSALISAYVAESCRKWRNLDEVIFVAKTKGEDDLSYLRQLIQTSDKYSADYSPYIEGLNCGRDVRCGQMREHLRQDRRRRGILN